MPGILHRQTWAYHKIIGAPQSLTLNFLMIFTPDNLDVFFINGMVEAEPDKGGVEDEAEMVDGFERVFILGIRGFDKGARGRAGNGDLGFVVGFVVMDKVEVDSPAYTTAAGSD